MTWGSGVEEKKQEEVEKYARRSSGGRIKVDSYLICQRSVVDMYGGGVCVEGRKEGRKKGRKEEGRLEVEMEVEMEVKMEVKVEVEIRRDSS